MAHKVLDESALFWDAQSTASWTATNHDSNAVDLGGDDLDEKDPGEIVVKTSGLGSAGAATVAIMLIDCDTSGGTYAAVTPINPTMVAIGYASVPAELRIPVPKVGVRRYLKVRVTVGTAALNAGTITAGLIK